MIRVRILNKAKDGVILKAGGLEQKISWEDFNSAWAIDPKDKLYNRRRNEDTGTA